MTDAPDVPPPGVSEKGQYCWDPKTPHSRPASGRIAVKVINHYGDEVMKVVEI